MQRWQCPIFYIFSVEFHLYIPLVWSSLNQIFMFFFFFHLWVFCKNDLGIFCLLEIIEKFTEMNTFWVIKTTISSTFFKFQGNVVIRALPSLLTVPLKLKVNDLLYYYPRRASGLIAQYWAETVTQNRAEVSRYSWLFVKPVFSSTTSIQHTLYLQY